MNGVPRNVNIKTKIHIDIMDSGCTFDTISFNPETR